MSGQMQFCVMLRPCTLDRLMLWCLGTTLIYIMWYVVLLY